MLKQYEKMLLSAQSLVKERDMQLESIRQRITIIAEIFEKKEIKQFYSFEVLCDFIHDKSKRLYKKYEDLLLESRLNGRVAQQEQNLLVDREMDI